MCRQALSWSCVLWICALQQRHPGSTWIRGMPSNSPSRSASRLDRQQPHNVLQDWYKARPVEGRAFSAMLLPEHLEQCWLHARQFCRCDHGVIVKFPVAILRRVSSVAFYLSGMKTRSAVLRRGRRPQVRMYGGAASDSITDSTTHVVVIPSPTTGQPWQLLGQVIKEHGGLPALKTLHRRLQFQQAHVVTQRLVICLTPLASESMMHTRLTR